MMPDLLIINKTQFGYHTDYYKYSEYLKDDFSITFLCFDSGLEKLTMPDINVKYVPNSGSRTIRGIRFILIALISILMHKGNVFIHYFEKCHILKKAFSKKKMILDIRTLSVNQTMQSRENYNKQMKASCSLFDFVTIISKGLQEKLELDNSKSSIVSLGSDIISDTDKNFDTLKLLYVGTLNGRKISDTVKGVSLFLKQNPKINLTYDIIGDGKEFENIKLLIQELGVGNIIKLYGRIPHFKLKPFFDTANVGISYIPMTDYYEHQPPTKTFEYILSGMPCIATKTLENKKIITVENGILCSDTPMSFVDAIAVIYKNKSSYRSEIIRRTLKEYSWKNIINTKLKPILERFN
jgi:glycosyltransferase involved in cell wall biosynthesis